MESRQILLLADSFGRDIRACFQRRIHIRTDIQSRELKYYAPCGRVLDDRAGNGFADLNDYMDNAEDMLRYVISYVLENAPRRNGIFQ